MWEKWPRLNGIRIMILHVARRFPLLGPLVTCKFKDHTQAAAEFLCTIILGTMPLWLDGLIGSVHNTSTTKTYTDIWKEVIVNGELYLYCASFLAPIFYIALTDKKGDKPFPSKLSFLISTTLILIVSASLFSMKRSKDSYNETLFVIISACLFVFSALLLYLATVYRNFKSFDFSADMYRQEDDFTDSLAVSRGLK
jgi:RsiW-degrading membrane proteinase PrsW (M82 family)